MISLLDRPEFRSEVQIQHLRKEGPYDRLRRKADNKSAALRWTRSTRQRILPLAFSLCVLGAYSTGLTRQSPLRLYGKIMISMGNFGGRTWARTKDPLIKSQLLYQLSYASPWASSGLARWPARIAGSASYSDCAAQGKGLRREKFRAGRRLFSSGQSP